LDDHDTRRGRRDAREAEHVEGETLRHYLGNEALGQGPGAVCEVDALTPG
jgi:hypothetical protein